ncbi:hypothetical protein Ngar_c21410 [Candidatus Nitrososphaera gargensis Ga9.2]|uniref:Uncharacterized protein n=1 Tax=Nitrososphaera gargensis (strain Ga9.2) TaxID=1237085 RepID=K0ICG7_NITGG|nr:hypothetical protein [Candidatus Nitrososphaera gargensis]AFU59071.1 hypothetical protein Ngar_c21410 [Candidatus Nitrososphaera gargensis Ga9.2]
MKTVGIASVGRMGQLIAGLSENNIAIILEVSIALIFMRWVQMELTKTEQMIADAAVIKAVKEIEPVLAAEI